MIKHLFAAHEERLQTLQCLLALQLRRRGLSFQRIAKRLEVGSKKAKRMVERGQALFPKETDAELTRLMQERLRKLGHSVAGLGQMIMKRPPGGKASRN